MTADEVDVRRVPKPQRHPLIFGRFDGLADGEAFVLVNSHDPRHLREEFERDQPGRFTWEYLETGPAWRIRIGKCSVSGLPHVLCDTYAVVREATGDPARLVRHCSTASSRADEDIGVGSVSHSSSSHGRR